ncbi:hypothetical protein ACTFOB_22755 [Bacillus cereus group sp. MYBK79-1]|uniref:hypothetical protein n=1 Tax=unclassified Bacillus cereus group TaxID=2750818 RepID=UPI003F7A3100
MNNIVLNIKIIVSLILSCIAGVLVAVGISSAIESISMNTLSKELTTILALLGIGIILSLFAIVINKKDIYKVLMRSTLIMGILLVFITLGFIMKNNTGQITLATIFNGIAAVVSFRLMKLCIEIEKKVKG